MSEKNITIIKEMKGKNNSKSIYKKLYFELLKLN